jgi:putative membrane protein
MPPERKRIMKHLTAILAVFTLMSIAGCEDYERDLTETDRPTTTPPVETPPIEPPPRDVTMPPASDDMDMPRGDVPTIPPATPPAIPDADAAALTPQDREFIAKAISGSEFEVQSSQIALEQNVGAQLEGVAEMLIKDHTVANTELQALAVRKGMTVPTAMAPEHQEMLDNLELAAGTDFGEKYREAQIKAHEEAIALFEECASSSKDADLKTFAQKTLPTLRAHLEHLRQSTQPAPEQPGS